MSQTKGITLSQLQNKIKNTIQSSLPNRIWIKCEVAAVKENISGHCYIDIVEKQSEDDYIIAKGQAVIWASSWRVIRPYFESGTGMSLSPGMKILLFVQIQYSELYGVSLIVNDIDPSFTIGEAEVLRRKVIERLEKEGMIGLNSALSLPTLPRRFAIISSENAAGYRDFMIHISENTLGFKFSTTLFPSPMQGVSSPAGIIASLENIAGLLEQGVPFDAVLIIRGGGSSTDLSCFDDYEMAINIAQFPIPVLTAIGHDQDYHIADMVSHTSVKTPTALADYLIDIIESADAEISSIALRLSIALSNKYKMEEVRIMNYLVSIRSSFVKYFLKENGRLDLIEQRVRRGDPKNILLSGHTLVMKSGDRISSINGLKGGDLIKVVFNDGVALCTVNETEINK